MTVELANPQPLYRQVYKSLKGDIEKGSYEPSSRLPTEPELAKKYDVSVITVRQAVSLLVDDRLVYKRQGKGTYVSRSKDSHVFKKVKTIGFLASFPKYNLDSSYEVLPEIIHEMEDEGSTKGYHFSIFNIQDSLSKAKERIKAISDGDIDGIVFWPTTSSSKGELNRSLVDTLVSMKVPVVLFDRQVPGCPLDYVTGGNEQGVHQLIEHLIGNGHRRIAVISDPESSTIRDRIAGYKKALLDAKIEIDPQLIRVLDRQGDMEVAAGEVEFLLGLDDRPTAIFATYDNLAKVAIETLQANGLSVPGDIAVAGYDNRQFAASLSLTTVDQHFGKMARAAVKRLCEKIEQEDDATRKVIVDSELVIRGSSGAAQ
ncbi:MAG: GntR family transcriptional regulator [Phycisphaerae bacterium]|nr:GntR family transcriptional regulator [Phycisphaerae bacterium]